MPVEVTEELELMVDKASDFAKLEPRETVNLKAFIVSGFDVKSVGMFQLTNSSHELNVLYNVLYKYNFF